jgi:anti-sigma regulatory factor (Ser/Thr protein kinase)
MANSTLKTYHFKAGFGEAEVLRMRESVAHQMHDAGIGGDSSYALINVLDEFCCNMMEYSAASWVEIVVEPGQDSINAILRDNGSAFDPAEAIRNVSPDHPAHVTDRRLGLYMVGLLAKNISYHRDGDVNHLEFSLKR